MSAGLRRGLTRKRSGLDSDSDGESAVRRTSKSRHPISDDEDRQPTSARTRRKSSVKQEGRRRRSGDYDDDDDDDDVRTGRRGSRARQRPVDSDEEDKLSTSLTDGRCKSWQRQDHHRGSLGRRKSRHGDEQEEDDEEENDRTRRQRHLDSDDEEHRSSKGRRRSSQKLDQDRASSRRRKSHPDEEDYGDDKDELNDPEVEEYWFVCNRWFAKGEDDGKIVRELLPTTEEGQPLDTGLQGLTAKFPLILYICSTVISRNSKCNWK